MYQERMRSYYPQAIQMIAEFQAIVGAEAPEFEQMSVANDKIVSDAYLSTMGEDRIAQWERFLGITPSNRLKLSERRDVIIARIRAQSKLNTLTINSIVNAFTGGSAESWVKDSTLYVEVQLPHGDKSFDFANIENEIKLKIPAHLNLVITRNYNTWETVKNDNTHGGWKEVRACYKEWFEVLYNGRTKPNELDVTTFDKFYLG